jgi:hypothetical protein
VPTISSYDRMIQALISQKSHFDCVEDFCEWNIPAKHKRYAYRGIQIGNLMWVYTKRGRFMGHIENDVGIWMSPKSTEPQG